MQKYLDKICLLESDRLRHKQQLRKCTAKGVTAFKVLAGSLNFLGNEVLPQALFAGSHLQQMCRRLMVKDWVTTHKVLPEVRSLYPSIWFNASSDLSLPIYLACSDAQIGSGSYGQNGYVSGISLPSGGRGIYYVIDWLSCKQSWVSFSSIGAEIHAAATFSNRAVHMVEGITVINPAENNRPFVLSIDTYGLYSIINTLHEGSDDRLLPTVAKIGKSFTNGEIETLQWLPGLGKYR